MDQRFHALPGATGRIGDRLGELVRRVAAMAGAGRSADQILLSDDDISALGRFVVTLDLADIGAFKTPSLRNVALTAPYMHDGRVPTLREAVDLEIYYRGARDGHPLVVTDSERNDLIAFLQSLTSFRAPD